MNFKSLLAQLDDLDDRCAETVAAGIANEVSEWAAKNGHPELVREWTPSAQVIEVKRYLAMAIAATQKPSADIERPYTVVQAAEILGVSKETVYREVSEGLMPHARIKSRITITAEQLAEYRRRKATTLPAQPGSFRHLGPRSA